VFSFLLKYNKGITANLKGIRREGVGAAKMMSAKTKSGKEK
jgi:hypothetical protein